jgi:PAS domain S-box-containing protein
MLSRSGEPAFRGATPEQQMLSLEALLDAMPDAVVGVDRSGVIRFVNRQTEAMFGYDQGVLVDQLIETLVPESFRTVHQAQREGYVADPKTRQMGTDLEVRGRRRDCTEFRMDVSLSHVHSLRCRAHCNRARHHAETVAHALEQPADSIETLAKAHALSLRRVFPFISKRVRG